MRKLFILLCGSLLITTSSADTTLSLLLKRGQQGYNQYCAFCHMPNGEGSRLEVPPLRTGYPYSSFIPSNAPISVNIDIVLHGIPGTKMPAFKALSNRDLAAIITFQRNVFGNHGTNIVTEDDVQRIRENKKVAVTNKNMTLQELMHLGQDNYQYYCARCHQLDGSGRAPHGPTLKGSYVAKNADLVDHKIKVVLAGLPGTRMRGYGQQLNNEQIASVVTYIANAWGNEGNQTIQPVMVQKERGNLRNKAVSQDADTAKTFTLEQLMKLGQITYMANCARCHLPNGTGGAQPGVPSLKGDSKLLKEPPLKHVDIVLTGVPTTIMRAFAPRLTNLELAAVITYERNAWGNNTGDVVQPALIQKERVRLKDTIEFQMKNQIYQQDRRENPQLYKRKL